MAERKTNVSALIAVLACPWLLVAGTCVLTAVSALMEEYPGASAGAVSLISTLPGLTMMVASVAAGILAGRFGSYKLWIIATGIVVAVTGSLPSFVTSFYAILVIRALLGFGLGMVFPVTNAIIFELYDGEERTKVLGWHSASQYMGAVVYTMAGGILSRVYWRYAFLIYLAALLPTLIILFFLPRVSRTVSPVAAQIESHHSRTIPSHGIFYLFLEFIGFVFIFPFSLNISVILKESGMGDSVMSGLVLSVNTIAAALAGLFFKQIYIRLRNYTIPLSFFACALGMFVLFISEHLILMFLGSVLCGMGISAFTLGIISTAGGFLGAESIALFSGLMSASSSLGTFCTSWYISVIERLGFTDARTPILGCAILFAAMTIITIFSELHFNNRQNTQFPAKN